MPRRQSTAESELSSINWGSVRPPLIPPSAKTPENPLRRMSVAKAELGDYPGRVPTPDDTEARQRRESLAALYPPTPQGVISLARDAASNHSSYWTNIYLLIILPPVLVFALTHRLGLALGAFTKATWHNLTTDPSDPSYVKAGALQIAAHLALVPALLATLYLNRDHPWMQYSLSALLGILLLALLPMRPLAAVINTLGRGRARVAAHLGRHAELYVFAAVVALSGAGIYALLDHINAELGYEETMKRGVGKNELAEQVVALRAELAAMRAAQGH